jgi:threonine 3-dehydrogenase
VPTADIAIDWNVLVFNMLTIKGIYGREMYETRYMMMRIVQSGLNVSSVISHRFGEDYQEAFATTVGGEAGKIVPRWK